MGNRKSTPAKGKSYNYDYGYPRGSGKPTSAYSRYSGAGMGSFTHCSQGGDRGHDKSVYIGRIRLTEVRGMMY